VLIVNSKDNAVRTTERDTQMHGLSRATQRARDGRGRAYSWWASHTTYNINVYIYIF